jgi:hypothetical protein
MIETPPNTSLEPTATRRCVENPETFVDHSLSFETTVARPWLSLIR